MSPSPMTRSAAAPAGERHDGARRRAALRMGGLRAARAVSVCLLAMACAPSVAPLPPPTTGPAPAPVEPTLGAMPRAVRIASAIPESRYTVRVVTALEVDSIGRGDSVPHLLYDTVSTVGVVALSGARASLTQPSQPGLLRASGTVSGVRIRTSARIREARTSALPGVAPVALSPEEELTVAFSAVFDTALARLTPTPPLANECDQPAVAAAELARDLLLRLPETLTPGAQWADSARVFACRAGVPITMQLVQTTRVDRLAEDGRTATLVRTVTMRADGRLTLGWRTVSLQGTGASQSTLTLRLPDGTVDLVTGTGESRFEASDSARPTAQRTRIVQRTTVEARRLTP